MMLYWKLHFSNWARDNSGSNGKGCNNLLLCIWTTQTLKRFCTMLSEEKGKEIEKIMWIALVLKIYAAKIVFSELFLNRVHAEIIPFWQYNGNTLNSFRAYDSGRKANWVIWAAWNHYKDAQLILKDLSGSREMRNQRSLEVQYSSQEHTAGSTKWERSSFHFPLKKCHPSAKGKMWAWHSSKNTASPLL